MSAIGILGRSLNIVTTAEGVETQKQLAILKTEGCTNAQGFIFSKPRSQVGTREFLKSLVGREKAVA